MRKPLAAVLCLCLIISMSFGAQGAEEEKKTAVVYTFKNSITEWDAKNSDVEGWIYIDGTNINYPVIFYPHDSYHYMSLGYDKKPSKNGVIYAEATTNSGTLEEMSLNTVLYGHNWTNVSSNPRIGTPTDVMFAQLTAFHHLDFAKEHQFLNYANSQGGYVFQVFAAFYSEVDFVFYQPNPSKEQFDEIVSGARARSLHSYEGIDVSYGDHIVTMATCTRAFGSSSEQRFVLMGKMVEAGAEPVTVTANPNYQRPKL